jgi:hypothetical protein
MRVSLGEFCVGVAGVVALACACHLDPGDGPVLVAQIPLEQSTSAELGTTVIVFFKGGQALAISATGGKVRLAGSSVDLVESLCLPVDDGRSTSQTLSVFPSDLESSLTVALLQPGDANAGGIACSGIVIASIEVPVRVQLGNQTPDGGTP